MLNKYNEVPFPSPPGDPLPGKDLDWTNNTSPLALVVDDDDEYINLSKLILRKAGYNVVSATNCDQALQKCSQFGPDIILLDLMMPDLDGWTTCRHLREITNAPILVVSAKSDQESIVHSLQIGADDYLTKPIHQPEYLARIETALRHTPKHKTVSGYSFPHINLTINCKTHEVSLGSQAHYLAPREFSLLEELAKHAPHPATYQELEQAIWHSQPPPDSHTCIKNLVFMLRRKLEQHPAQPALILNFRGIGYTLQTHSQST